MSLRETLSALSKFITLKMKYEPGFMVTDMSEVREMCQKYGTLYLIICDNIPGHTETYYSLHTRSELGSFKIPPGMFSKPDKTLALQIATRQFRQFSYLSAVGLL